jgi:trehalose/maltose transport system substrate-binding protein
MRNWPDAQNDIDRSSIARHVDAVALPAWKDGNRASVLGGHNLVISRYSANPATALKLVDYLTQTDVIRRDAIEHAQPPVLRDLWEESAVRRALPAPDALSDAIRVGNAQVRPVVPNYKQVSDAIYTNVNRALAGDATPEQALRTANEEMQLALDDAYRRSSP